MIKRPLGCLLAGVFLIAGCSTPLTSDMQSMNDDIHVPDSDGDQDDADVPGDPSDEPWFDDSNPDADWGKDDLSCDRDGDCNSDEVCLSGICQIDRCSAAGYTSITPLGNSFIFFADREIAVADGDDTDGSYYADLYSPEGAATSYDTSLRSEAGRLLDITAGDFMGNGSDVYVGIMEAGSGGTLRVLSGDSGSYFSLPFEPRAVDAGDLDRDGRWEAVAIGEHELRICDFVDGDCEDFEREEELIDVAVGDVDGDGYMELVVLQRDGGTWSIWIHNADAEYTGQSEEYITELEIDDLERISVGDMDGDGMAEIIVLDDKGFWGTRNDHIAVLVFSEDDEAVELVLETSVDYRRIVDIAVGDLDADGFAELVALDSHNKVISFSYDNEELELMDERSIYTTSDPKFIALGDHDGDSPRTELTGGPEVVSGATVPTVLLYLPPFSYDYSNGWSSVGYGMGETYSETYSDTISLSINADVGVRAEFLSLFKASFTQSVAWKTSQTLGSTSSLSTGGRSSLRSDPDVFGKYYGAVVVSWGCFHAYTYEVVDPNGIYEDADGEPIVVIVPVDGGTAMLSTNRYNAMAEIVGDLPEMPVPYKVGDPTTYPTSMETIYGDPIDEDDLVFPDLVWYEVSDVGYVGWFNQMAESGTESSTVGIDESTSASVTVNGITVGAGFSVGWGNGYSVTRGETALFNGAIPPFVDDPATSADEYVDNFYRVAPVTYLQEYTDSGGKLSKFYVTTYVVDL